MRLSPRLAVASALIALAGVVLPGGGEAVAAAGPTDGGALHLESSGAHVGETIRFSFATATPDATNWIGVYADPATVPTNGVSHGASTAWTYVPATTTGVADLATAGLPAGATLTAVLLYHDGYQRLAPPITFTLAPKPPTVGSDAPTTAHFVTDDVVEPTATVGAAVHRSVAGLWRAVDGSAPTSAVRFAATAAPAWVHVAPDGLVTGTAPGSVPPHPALVTVTATDTDGVTGTIVLEFPVAASRTVPTLKVETLEAWDGGAHVDDPIEKLARSVLHDRIDLLTLQDTGGTEGAALAALLDWHVQESPDGLATLTPYAIAPRAGVPTGVPAIASTVTVGGRAVSVWNVALAVDSVDPAQVCTTGATSMIAAQRGTETHRQAVALAGALRRQVASGERVVLLGALRSPSHLDWTAGADTCGVGPVAWPVTTVLARAGLSDAFRTANPSVARDPGSTADVFSGHSASPEPTRADVTAVPATIGRTDAVQFGGPVRVTEAHTAVDGFPVQSARTNAWTSDRAAVAATLVLTTDDDAGSGGHGSGGHGSGGHGSGNSGSGASGGGTDPHHDGSGAGQGRPAAVGSPLGSGPAGLLAFTGPGAVVATAALALALLALGAFITFRRRRVRVDPADGGPDLVLDPIPDLVPDPHQEGTS